MNFKPPNTIINRLPTWRRGLFKVLGIGLSLAMFVLNLYQCQQGKRLAEKHLYTQQRIEAAKSHLMQARRTMDTLESDLSSYTRKDSQLGRTTDSLIQHWRNHLLYLKLLLKSHETP